MPPNTKEAEISQREVTDSLISSVSTGGGLFLGQQQSLPPPHFPLLPLARCVLG